MGNDWFIFLPAHPVLVVSCPWINLEWPVPLVPTQVPTVAVALENRSGRLLTALECPGLPLGSWVPFEVHWLTPSWRPFSVLPLAAVY